MPKSIHCIIVDDEPIAREILASYIKQTKSLNLVKSCKNAVEAFQIISEKKIDLILLDINMPDMSGLALAKVIDQKIKIIFTTAHREYAVEGFELQAVDYLLKPISFERFAKAIQKLTINPNSTQESDPIKAVPNSYFFVRANRRMIKINYHDVLYMESISDYIKIYLPQKTIVTRETISGIGNRLPPSHFLRVHRSFIIALHQVHSYSTESVEIKSTTIPISRSYRKDTIARLNNLSNT